MIRRSIMVLTAIIALTQTSITHATSTQGNSTIIPTVSLFSLVAGGIMSIGFLNYRRLLYKKLNQSKNISEYNTIRAQIKLMNRLAGVSGIVAAAGGIGFLATHAPNTPVPTPADPQSTPADPRLTNGSPATPQSAPADPQSTPADPQSAPADSQLTNGSPATPQSTLSTPVADRLPKPTPTEKDLENELTQIIRDTKTKSKSILFDRSRSVTKEEALKINSPLKTMAGKSTELRALLTEDSDILGKHSDNISGNATFIPMVLSYCDTDIIRNLEKVIVAVNHGEMLMVFISNDTFYCFNKTDEKQIVQAGVNISDDFNSQSMGLHLIMYITEHETLEKIKAQAQTLKNPNRAKQEVLFAQMVNIAQNPSFFKNKVPSRLSLRVEINSRNHLFEQFFTDEIIDQVLASTGETFLMCAAYSQELDLLEYLLTKDQILTIINAERDTGKRTAFAIPKDLGPDALSIAINSKKSNLYAKAKCIKVLLDHRSIVVKQEHLQLLIDLEKSQPPVRNTITPLIAQARALISS